MDRAFASMSTRYPRLLPALTAVTAVVAALAIMRIFSKKRQEGGSLEDKNLEFYGKMASMYDKFAGQAAFHQLLDKELIARKGWIGIDLDGKQLRVLDYACGTGVISQVLAPYSQQILGVDLSEAMVDAYNAKAVRLGLTDVMIGMVGNLLRDSATPAQLSDANGFDLVIVGLGFHHFGNLEQAVKQLAERLKPGGALCIIDFGSHEPMSMSSTTGNSFGGHGHHQGHRHGQHGHYGHGQGSGAGAIAHSGFGKPEVKKLLETAGLQDVAVDGLATGFVWGPPPLEDLPEEDRAEVQKYLSMMTIKRDIFIAKGMKSKL